MNSENLPVQHSASLEIILKALDWPFLLFVTFLIFMLLFRKQLYALLSRGDILLSWGDGKSVRLRDLSDKIDQELDPLKEDIDQLQGQTEELAISPQGVKQATAIPFGPLERMKKALADPRFRWRRIERLATIGGVDESKALELLRSDPTVVFELGKSGRTIARLVSR